MKMISDVDMYYDCMNSRKVQPQWMAAERMDYCDGAANIERKSLFDIIAKLFA